MIEQIVTHRRDRLAHSLQTGGLVLAAILASVAAGQLLPEIPTLVIVFLLLPLIPIVAQRPIVGYYVFFPVLLLVPYWMRTPFPFLNSPLEIMAVTTLALAIARFVRLKKSLPGTPLYFPWLLCLMILLAATVTGYGPDSGYLLYRLISGSWTFFLVLLLVETPHQARNVLAMAIGSVCVVAALWLPFMISFTLSQPIRGVLTSSLLRYYDPTFTGTLVSWLGVGGVNHVVVVALTIPVLFSLTLSTASSRLRRLSGLTVIVLVLFLFFALITVPILGAILGIGIVILLELKAARRRTLSRGLILLLLGGIVLALTPPAQLFWGHVRRGFDFPGVEPRLLLIRSAIQVFLDNPIMGVGGYVSSYWTDDGTFVPSHTFLFTSAYQYGVVYLAAWLLIFGIVGRQAVWLLRQPLPSPARSVVVGLLASLIVTFCFAIIGSTPGDIHSSNYFWLFVGLIDTWVRWLRRSPNAPLLS